MTAHPFEREGASLAPGRIGWLMRALHWATAILIACGFAAAWLFNALGSSPTADRLVEIHRSIGLAVLLLAFARVALRLARPLPPLPATTPRWERWAANGVQVLLYLCLFAMPLLGWSGSNAQGDDVPLFGVFVLPALAGADQDLGDRVFQFHALVGYAILRLLTLHVAGALRHHLVKRDGVLTRMVRGQATPSKSPASTRP